MQQGRTTTFEKLRDQAIHFDQFQHRQRIKEAKEKRNFNTRSSEGKNASRESSTSNHSNDPANDTRKRKFTISRGEYERRKALHLCFDCVKMSKRTFQRIIPEQDP